MSVLFFLQLISCTDANQETKPNIVFVLADDLGIPQVGCYGSTFYNTPNIDKLALNGVRYTNAYSAAAVCSPTRAAILTGKNPARINITDFISGNPNSNYPLSQPEWQKHLPIKEITIAEILKKEGYKTALFGKWHLSKKKTPPVSQEHGPSHQGFDHSFMTYKPADYLPLRPWQKAEEDAHNVDTLTNLAIDFIRQNKDSSFFLMLSHNTIHDPLMERQASISEYYNGDTLAATNNAVLAAMVERMDQAFGKLYQTLEQLNLLDNTLIVFYSDNGGLESDADQAPYRKGKGWLYEGGIRVPLIMQWKGQIEASTLDNRIVTSMDLFPTFAHAASANHIPSFDGIDLFDTVKKTDENRLRSLYWNYPHYHAGTGMRPAVAIRSGNYKLIKWYEPYLFDENEVFELYNLADDPGESKNLVNEYPEKVLELNTQLEEWKVSAGAQEPTINPDYTID